MATTTAAEDEFNALLARNAAPSCTRHRADSSSSVSSTSSSSSAAVATVPHVRTKDDSSGQDDDDDDDDAHARARTALPRHLPSRGANTGPKGVIADAAAFDAARHERERARQQQRQRLGGRAARADEGASGLDATAGRHWDEKDCAADALDGWDADADADVGADSAFLDAWRQRRIAQLAATTRSLHTNVTASTGASLDKSVSAAPASPLRHVSGAGFLRALQCARRGQSVVVYIGDATTSALSEAYATHLGALAGKHTGSVWVRLDAETAEVDEAGLPALLVYRDGEQVVSWVPLRDEVAVTCNVVTNLEEALRVEGVL